MSIYLNNPWKPIPHSIVKSSLLQEELHTKGYSVLSFSDNSVIKNLQNLYEELHNIKNENGGMFYSIYSQNLEYRKKVHFSILELLNPFLEKHFCHYKAVLNSFVVKLPGPKSEFYLHQDTTGLDEWKYSPLSLWIPLQGVDETNGCLGIVPHSQHFFTPYRSISFPAPFDGIQTTVKKYLSPLRMKKGEVLVFDNRILHHSYANNSGQERVAVICGLFPLEARVITCHKPVYECGGKVELIQHEDDFLLSGKNFLIDCQKRPEVGKSLGWEDDFYHEISEENFEQLCSKFGVQKMYKDIENKSTDCEMISEPVSENTHLKPNKTSLFDKVLSFIQ